MQRATAEKIGEFKCLCLQANLQVAGDKKDLGFYVTAVWARGPFTAADTGLWAG